MHFACFIRRILRRNARFRRPVEPAQIAANLNEISQLVESAGVPVFVGGRFSVLLQRELEQIGAQPLGDNFALGLRLIKGRYGVEVKRQFSNPSNLPEPDASNSPRRAAISFTMLM